MSILAFSIVFFMVNFEQFSGNKFLYLVYLILIASAQIFGSSADSNVDNFGHAGGFIMGGVLTLVLYPKAY